MADERFPRNLVRKVEQSSFPLIGLGAARDIRRYLDEFEKQAILAARELGASADDIADALGITRQGAYYKIKNLKSSHDQAAIQPEGADAEQSS